MRRLVALLAALMTICLVASGCTGSGADSAGSNGPRRFVTNGSFTMVLSDASASFDPYARGPLEADRFLYDSLVNLQPDGKFVSGLAASWSTDARSASFTLRKGVTCSDRTPLTAGQVAAAINYVSDPKNGSTQYGINTPTVPLSAVGDDEAGTVKITLKHPFGFLLHTIGLLPIVCQKGMRNRTLLTDGSAGTGPYVLSNTVPGQTYTFTIREDYSWGPGGQTTKTPGLPAKILVRIVPNETTASNLLLSGNVNMARVTGEDQQRLIARGMKKVVEPLSGAWLWFDQRADHPTLDMRVRQALVSALDIPQIIKINTGGRGSRATGLVTRAPRICDADVVSGNLPQHNVAAAESLLDQAGWTKGADGVRSKNGKPLAVNVRYAPAFSSNYEEPTTELIAQQWKAIGVQVRQNSDTTAQFTQTLKTGDFDVYVQGYFLYLPSQLVPLVSGATPAQKGRNFAGIDNAEFNQLAAKAATMTPPDACSYWNQAERELVRNLDIVPIADRPRPWYLNHAEAEFVAFEVPIPMSIRLLK
jgi:peptide/nickel transport system substrate-binding protein